MSDISCVDHTALQIGRDLPDRINDNRGSVGSGVREVTGGDVNQ